MDEEQGGIADALEVLQTSLGAALDLTRELAGDPVLGRLLAAFRDMPAEDRPVVVEAIARETKARALSRATEDVTGQSMFPNPNARLYVRVHESTVDRGLLERDEMMLATVRALRVARIVPDVPEIYAGWREATREALEHADAGARAAVERLVRDVLAMLREVCMPPGGAGTVAAPAREPDQRAGRASATPLPDASPPRRRG